MRSAHSVGYAIAVWSTACQSQSTCLVGWSSGTWEQGWCWCHAMKAMMGNSNPFPLGIPMEACTSCPWSCCNCQTLTVQQHPVLQSSFSKLLTLVGGKRMQQLIPSNTQPSISFDVSHMPSPLLTFLRAMGSSYFG